VWVLLSNRYSSYAASFAVLRTEIDVCTHCALAFDMHRLLCYCGLCSVCVSEMEDCSGWNGVEGDFRRFWFASF
jgi:hypothetical protein